LERRVFCTHPHEMRIGPKGVEQFSWPVGLDELGAWRDRFLTDLYAWIRSEGVERDRDAELIWMNAGQIATEFLRLCNGHVVQRRLSAAGWRSDATHQGASLFTNLAEGKIPPPAEATRRTLAGHAPDPLWRRPLRAFKHHWRKESLRYRPRPLIRPERDIVTFSASELIVAHARRLARPVTLSKFAEWMTPGDLSSHGLPSGVGRQTLDQLLGLAENVLAQAGEPFPPVLKEAFAQFVTALTQRTRFYLEELETRPERLPRVYWSGTSGILMNRVMSRAVAKAGGQVIGHDHGTGTGWWQTHYQTVFELNFVQEFVTYSPAMAEGLARNYRRDLTAFPDRLCRITPLMEPPIESPAEHRHTARRPAPSRRAVKRVLYTPTAYTGDSMYLLPLLSDPVAVDWQARLLEFLRARNYEIAIKPHPDSHCSPPPAFARMFGCKVVEQSFEEVMADSDLILFDYLQTSCIVSAARSDRPIVLVEFPRLLLDPAARELLAARCAIVKGWFGDDGRAEIDWQDLERALTTAPDLSDRRFVETYYPQGPAAAGPAVPGGAVSR